MGVVKRNSSNAFKGDRFIPYRGIDDNYMEEYMISNDIYGRD
jgi:hypothetical protein